MAKILMSLSGGLDSTVLLADLKAKGHEVHAVGFRYGAKHNVYENNSARGVAAVYGATFWIIDLTPTMRGFNSALTNPDKPIPEGHYEAESMRQTVVPGRNGIFLAMLAGIAQSEGFDHVAIGIHAGDHFIYPDCRPSFFLAFRKVIEVQTEGKVSLSAPYLTINKSDIVRIGLARNVPFNLTRTCYKDQPVACGKCGSCQERLEAFAKNNAEDPLEYESRELLPK